VLPALIFEQHVRAQLLDRLVLVMHLKVGESAPVIQPSTKVETHVCPVPPLVPTAQDLRPPVTLVSQDIIYLETPALPARISELSALALLFVRHA
jgi:hypothetical protein